VTLSRKDAGSSCPSGPTATIFTDHLRMGKPSPACGTSGNTCCAESDVKDKQKLPAASRS
jgi:hypothetical protein